MVGSTQAFILLSLIGVLTGACSSEGGAVQRIVATYRCADDRSFTVELDPHSATVRYADSQYRLSRHPSSLGLRYASGDATLMIDRDFAAFVTETVVDLNGCRTASRMDS